MPATATVRVPCGPVHLMGDLVVPEPCAGVVVFAHGSGSGRHSPRNQQVARRLQQGGCATLLLDLLTAEEEKADLHTRQHRFDIPLLAGRMVCATRWVAGEPLLAQRPVGYFGASTGSAAALIAAAELGDAVAAVVSRGGRPDLAGAAALASVRCPTLLIVGGDDEVVIDLNRAAYERLHVPRAMEIVPGAGHLFEEPGALEHVADAAARWFGTHLARPPRHEETR